VLRAAFVAAIAQTNPGRSAAEIRADSVGCTTSSNPALTVVTCPSPGLRPDGRLGSCTSAQSCVASGAVSSPSKFSPAWAPNSLSPESRDVARAFRALCSAVEEQPGVNVDVRDEARFYLHATAVSSVPADGTDDLEFLLRPPSGGQGCTLSFRSATQQSVYVYPLTQPLIDQDSHMRRLAQIRSRLGWEELGLASDSALEAGMPLRQARNFFGLQFQGIRAPDDDDYDD